MKTRPSRRLPAAPRLLDGVIVLAVSVVTVCATLATTWAA